MTTLTLDPVLGLLAGAAFALLFASAALHKLRDLAQFNEVFLAYRLPLPQSVRLSLLVPLAELAVTLALLIGLAVPGWRGAAALTGAVLLTGYAAGILLNLVRGRRDLACGCGGADDAQTIAPWMVVRNLLLAALLLAALSLPWTARVLTYTDWLTLACAVPAVALLYLTFDRLAGRVLPQGALLRQPASAAGAELQDSP